jgi:hypothetical protein
MSKKQFEENLNYGDCNSLFCFFNDVLQGINQGIENTIDKIIKK